MNTKSPIFSGRRGFSLVELLVVIAVIAIIAAIAIPNISNITRQADTVKVQRNAQTVVAVATAALAAGYEPGASWNVRSNIIRDLMSGTIRVSQGQGDNKLMFKISEIAAEDIPAMEGYIEVVREGADGGVVPIIEYVSSGTVAPDPGH